MSEVLPEGWTITEVGELNLSKTRNVDPRHTPEDIFELYSVPNFPKGEPEISTGQEIGSTKQIVQENDVLICKINPRLNRVWVVDEANGYNQIASSEWIVIRNSITESSYLRHLFSAPEFRDELCKDLTGVGGSLTRAQPKRVAKISIPLPPLNEQRRIADKLDVVLGAVARCKARLDKAQTLLKRFRQSTLNAATTGQLTEDWRAGNEHSISREKAIEAILSDLNFKPKWKLFGADYISHNNIPANWAGLYLGEIASVKSGNGLTAKKMVEGEVPVYGGNGVTGYHNEGNITSRTIVIGRVGFYCGSIHVTPDSAWVTDNAMIISFSDTVIGCLTSTPIGHNSGIA